MDFILWEILNANAKETTGCKAMLKLWWMDDPAEMDEWEIRLGLQEQEVLLNKMQQRISIENTRNETGGWTEKSAKTLPVNSMREMRFDKITDASQGWKPDEQFKRKYQILMPGMPCCRACSSRGVGKKENTTAEKMCDMWSIVCPNEEQGQAMQSSIVLKRYGGKIGRVALGIKDRVNRLKSLGNGQVPRVAAAAFTILAEHLMT